MPLTPKEAGGTVSLRPACSIIYWVPGSKEEEGGEGGEEMEEEEEEKLQSSSTSTKAKLLLSGFGRRREAV